ncbi:hypothetical protein FRC09_007833 [Ceratobasidium sp. 395]|nr:hypothetical protein FRC09_007833 [Ceratobasidium sp. 395]
MSAFHFAPISHGPITAQWSASNTGGNVRTSQHKYSQSDPSHGMYNQYQQQPQQYAFPPAQPSSSHGHGHSRTGADVIEDEDELERQLDYETDANTEYNAALLSANIRPRALPPTESSQPPGREKGKGKSRERGKDKDKAAKARRQRQRADHERRTRRREQGLDSDTTQGDDTDDGEYVTGYGSSRRHVSAGAGFKPTPSAQQQQQPPTSSSMPNIPPTSAHPYVSPVGQYGYPQQQQAQPGYGGGYGGYSAQPLPPLPGAYGSTPQQPQFGGNTPGGGYFSPNAPASAQFPNLFASTDPRKASNDQARQAAEEAGRRKLRENPLPGLPGQAGASGGMSGLDRGGMPGLDARGMSGLDARGMPGLDARGMPSLDARGMPGLDGRGGMPGLDARGMPGLDARGMPIHDSRGAPGGLGSLPGGYGGQPATREKSKSKAHAKAASTGTLPAQQAGYSQYAPPTRAPKTSDPPTLPSKSSKGRLSRDRDRGRSGDRDRDRDQQDPSRSRSRQRPGWDTAESLLNQPTDGLRGVRDGPAILNGHGHGGGDGRGPSPTMINGVPVVNAGPPLERISSRSKWGKITGLFTRGRRGSAASRDPPDQPVYNNHHHIPPPPSSSQSHPPPTTTRHKSGLRNLSFDRFRRGGGNQHQQPPPPLAPDHLPALDPHHFPLPPRDSRDRDRDRDRPDVGFPPGQVPLGIHVDKYGKIIDPPEEFMGLGGGGRAGGRVQGFRPGRGDEKVEGPVRLDGPTRRTSSDVGFAGGIPVLGRGDHPPGMMRRTSSDAPLPGGYGIGLGPPPPLPPQMGNGRRPSMESRRPSLEGPDAYGPAPRHRAGSGSSHVQPPPPLTGTIGNGGMPGFDPGISPGIAAGIPSSVIPALGGGGIPPLGGGGGIPPLGGGGIPPPNMKSPAGLARQSSWDARSPAGMGTSLVSPHTPRGVPSPHIPMPSPHLPKGTPRYAAESLLSPRPSEAFTQTGGRYEAAGATPYMREREPSIATTVPRTLPRPRTADSTVFGGTMHEPPSPSETPSPDVTEVDAARAAQHREAFEWAEQEAVQRVEQGDDNAPYIFNGFPTWVNWDLFTRLENEERMEHGETPLPRVTSVTKPEKLQDIYDEWHSTRDKWVDRFWDPAWARFMHETGGPIQRELATERQTAMGRALEAARVYQRENSELPLAKREFSRGYLWDEGYMHKDWQWIKVKPWRWTVEHENDERRATGRAPLPRFNPGMNQDDWRDVRDVWHTTASKWAEKRKDLEWVNRDRREGITPERRMYLEQQFLRSRQQHNVIRKASGQRSREALRPEERDKMRHDSAMEVLARRQEAYKHGGMTPRVSEAELARREQARRELDELMRTPATVHPRPASSVGHGSMRRGEGGPGSVRLGGSSVGHADGYARRMDDESSAYESTTSEDVPPASPYLRAPGGPPPPPDHRFPDWMRGPKTSDPPSVSMPSVPGRNPPPPLVNKPKKPGIIKGILKRTLSMQRNNNNNQNGPGRNNTNSTRNEQPSSFGGVFGHGHSRSEVSPVDNPWAGVYRSAHPVTVQPLRFDRNHAFSMTSPHGITYEGKLYPSAIHLWHAMRFLRRPAGRGRGRAEESWRPELAEGIRNAAEPELSADQWAHAGAIGKDGAIMRSLQRPDWEEVQMEKMDEVLALKFTQHPSLGKMLMSTAPAQLLYMWDAPWGAGADLKGPNNLGKAIMRCRERLMLQYQGR